MKLSASYVQHIILLIDPTDRVLVSIYGHFAAAHNVAQKRTLDPEASPARNLLRQNRVVIVLFGKSGPIMPRMRHQQLLKGLIRLHILHHAAKAPFYGQWMIRELARHGYVLSPGTLYPMLHGLERSGYLRSKIERSSRTFRRLYRATALGREANKLARVQVRELLGELTSRSARL